MDDPQAIGTDNADNDSAGPELRALQPKTTKSRITTLGLLAMLAIAVLLSVLSFNRKVTGFQSSGLELTSTTAGWLVEQTSGATELQTGDILIHVEGQFPTTKKEAEQLLSSAHISQVAFTREGELREGAHRRPPLRIDFSYLVLALIGVTYLFIGLYTLLRGVSGQVALFVVWCACSALVYLISPSLPPPDRLGLLFLSARRVLSRTLTSVDPPFLLDLPASAAIGQRPACLAQAEHRRALHSGGSADRSATGSSFRDQAVSTAAN